MANQVAPWIREARAASWWLTKNDFYWPDYDVEEEIVRRAGHYGACGVNMVVIFGLHFRWDYVPYCERLRSLFRRIVEECHKHNIRVCDHYSDTLTHRPRNDADRWFIRERLNHHVAIYPDFDQDYVYQGTARNSWRQVDVRTGEAAYYEAYRCNIFCPNNPDFQRASLAYALGQFETAGIDGMMNDDLEFLPDPYYSCACEHCRRRFRDEYGRELPPAADKAFWGQRRNPAFMDWLAMRQRSTGDHYVRLRAALGPERPLFACCSSMDGQWSSDLGCVHDEFSRGLNVVAMEMVPRNPVVEWGPLFARQSIYQAVAAAGDFLRGEATSAAAVDRPDPFIGLIYGRTPAQLFMGWALVSAWGARSWVCKDTQAADATTARAQYDDEAQLSQSFGWQASHEFLYAQAMRKADATVVFSPPTRTFGLTEEAETHRRQLIGWMWLMAENGILAEAMLAQGLQGKAAGRLLAAKRPLLVLPCVTALREKEFEGIVAYLQAGGNVLVTGELGLYNATGATRMTALTQSLRDQTRGLGGQLCHLSQSVIEAARPHNTVNGAVGRDAKGEPAAIRECLQVLRQCLPSPILRPGNDAEGWTYHLYEQGDKLLLHFLNLSGTVPRDGRAVTEDRAVRFDTPASGIIACAVRWEQGRQPEARLYSPDGAEAEVVEVTSAGGYAHLRIPAKQASHYGIVVIGE